MDTGRYVYLLKGRVPSTLWKRNSLNFPWYFPEKVPKFHENYFPFNEAAGKSRSGSCTANCYCLERCVIFTKATITSQSMNTTWTHPQDAHVPQNGENLSLLGHCHKFPRVSPDFVCFPQIPCVFPGKMETHFSRFPLISRVAGNPVNGFII